MYLALAIWLATMSQQVAKNLFLWRNKDLLRKGLEAWFTLLLELTWPKRRILEVYLNIVEFGAGRSARFQISVHVPSAFSVAEASAGLGLAAAPASR